jgi:hypothetical protein
MQTQPTSEIHRTVPPTARVKHNSEGGSTSSRSSTSSWIDEPIVSVNMDIMTGHIILVCRLL